MKTTIKSAVVTFIVGAAMPMLAHADEVQVGHPVTVVPLYSTTVPALAESASVRPVVTQPIQVVAGGVKSMPGSCFDLAPNSEVNPASGNCVVLLSAVAR